MEVHADATMVSLLRRPGNAMKPLIFTFMTWEKPGSPYLLLYELREAKSLSSPPLLAGRSSRY
jgi:hypothetical protein